MQLLLLIKLFASPSLIGLASLAGKRWGPNIAGMLGGMPLVAGPAVWVMWLMHGDAFTHDVIRAAPAGVWANVVYMLAMGWASAKFSWLPSLIIAWVAYLLTAYAIHQAALATTLWFSLAVMPALWLAAARLLPAPKIHSNTTPLPRIELITRMVAAAMLVIGLTAIAQTLGPTLTGIFTAAPVAATVIPAFTYAQTGRDALLLTLRGFLTGLFGFVAFFLILSHGLSLLGGWALFTAIVVGLLAGFVATRYAKPKAIVQ